MHRSVLLLALACAQALTSCTATEPAHAASTHRLLFIGNSLTYTNDLPALVAAVAASDGVGLDVASDALPNYALIDHVTSHSAVGQIGAGPWTAVVLQQGPTPPGVCRDTLVLATQALDALVRTAAKGARTATLMTWPYDGYPDAFTWVHASARAASDAIGGLFLPAGDAWMIARQLDASIELYGPDGYHPSMMGSLLAAYVIYEGIFGRDSRQLPATLQLPLNIPEQRVRILQQAAHAAFAGSGVTRPQSMRSVPTEC